MKQLLSCIFGLWQIYHLRLLLNLESILISFDRYYWFASSQDCPIEFPCYKVFLDSHFHSQKKKIGESFPDGWWFSDSCVIHFRDFLEQSRWSMTAATITKFFWKIRWEYVLQNFNLKTNWALWKSCKNSIRSPCIAFPNVNSLQHCITFRACVT